MAETQTQTATKTDVGLNLTPPDPVPVVSAEKASGLVPLDECSIVAAPYEVDGVVVGTVGVIGPTRMAYERVIPIVDVTAKLVSSALSQH